MRQPIIQYNETDFEANLQDYYTCMSYKGEPFTGTLVDGNMTTQFKNGNAHGKSVEYYDNGQLADESYFDNGDYVGDKTWYPNGKIESERAVGKNDSFQYDIDGNIILKNDNFFYKNGNFRKRNIPYKTEFYNYEGELMVVIQQDLKVNEKPLFHILSQSEDDKKFAITAINTLLNDERNHDKYDLEDLLQMMDKVDLANEWRKYYTEIIELK